MTLLRRMVFCLALLLLPHPADALEFGRGPLPITHMAAPPARLAPGDAIEIAGTVSGGNTNIVLRVDDKWGAEFADRFNGDKTLPPGPFTWVVPASAIKAGNGRSLNLDTIRQVVLFVTSGGSVEVSTFRTAGAGAGSTPARVAPPAPAANTAVLDFGRGPLPITHMATPPVKLAPGGLIEIAGTVSGGETNIVLRVDDKWGAEFADRFNGDKAFPPGPFTWVVPVSAIKAGNGRPLNLDTIRQIVLFVTSGGSVEVSTFRSAGAGDAANRPAATAAPLPAAAKPGVRAPMSLPTGRGTMRYEPAGSVDATGRQVVVEGSLEGSEPVGVLLRIDDLQSRDYPSRVGIERTLPPGPFRFQTAIDGLRTPNGRTIDAGNIRRIIFGAYPDTSKLVVTRFDLVEVHGLADGAIGYALGAKEAALPNGFERIAPGDARLSGPAVAPVRRTRPDPLVANGMRGLSRIRLAAPPGKARVTIWSEDPGDWETLPQFLNRTIRANGVTVVADALTPAEWLARRYLRGRWQEHDAASDTWSAYGVLRGDRRTVEVDVGLDGITIEIDAGSIEERFVSAVLIEKAGSTKALGQVEDERAEYYRSNWRTVPAQGIRGSWPYSGITESTRVHLGTTIAKSDAGSGSVPRHDPLKAKIAPGSGARLSLEASAAQRITSPLISVVEPKRSGGGPALRTHIWAGLWKLTQRDMSSSLHTLWDEQLMSDVGRLDIKPALADGAASRRYELWVDVPDNAPAGAYTGHVRIGTAGAWEEVPIEIEVLGTKLPPLQKPVGFYLEYPAHLSWRGATRLDRERQAKCDLDMFAKLGLNGTAPPISVPLRDGLEIFTAETRAAKAAGVAPGWLLYDPLRGLRNAYGDERAARIGAAAVADLKRLGLPLPVFTAADEPGNPEQFTKGLQPWMAALRAASPDFKLAGHLNNPGDAALVGLFDVAIVNSGFGLDFATIDRVANTGKSVWIYNTFEPRLTAGLWLTYSRAERYVQWHARLPTADPYDPLDGREVDVQVLYPTQTVCPAIPDIHRDLLRLADGGVDQRWLLWLQARNEPEARQLAQKLRGRLGTSWSSAVRLTDKDIAAMRAEIVTLAQKLEK